MKPLVQIPTLPTESQPWWHILVIPVWGDGQLRPFSGLAGQPV